MGLVFGNVLANNFNYQVGNCTANEPKSVYDIRKDMQSIQKMHCIVGIPVW